MQLLLLASSTLMRGKHDKARLCLKFSFIVSLLFLCFSFSLAQPTLVKDINTAESSEFSQHGNLIQFNGTLYFTAFSPAFGMELWKTNGGEPVLIKDITPGSASSTISNLTVVNNTLFFTANTSGTDAQSVELWKTDGTLSGTTLVKDIKPGTAGSSPQDLVNMNGILFFSADDGVNGRELWKSNGSAAGTVLVKDISLVATNTAPINLTDVNGTLYFTIGSQLWKSNGTATGTLLVKEIGNSSNPGRLTNANGTLFFTAYETYTSNRIPGEYYDYYTLDGEFQLWKSDGNTNGTMNIKTIHMAQNSGYSYEDISMYPVFLQSINNIVFFTVSYGFNTYTLYKTDGTTEGTIGITTVGGNANSYDGYYSPLFTKVGNLLYFVSAQYLMRSDGTATGTFSVKNTGVKLHSITSANNNLYLSGAADGKVQLWKSDGTAAGTSLIKNSNKSGNGTTFNYLTYSGDNLYFIEKYFENSLQLWKSNGSETSTVPVVSTHPSTENSAPLLMSSLNGTIFFSADDGVHGEELWKSNGTAAGTSLVKDITPGPLGYDFGYSTVLNNSIFFSIRAPAPIGEGYALWKSDGTAEGTSLVMPGSHSIGTLTNVNGTLFFANAGGGDLYKINETATGVVRVKYLMPRGCCPNSANYTDVNGTLFFTAWNNSLPPSFGLWKSDGTEAGTIKIKDIIDNGSIWTYNVVNVNGTVYFTANGQLWKSDGTTEGTIKVKEMPFGVDYRQIKYLTNVKGTLFFVAQNTFQDGWELWKSDGTEAGTVQVKDINPHGSSSPMHLTNVNGTLFFTAVDDKEGTNRELWKSDGTQTGTIKLTNTFVKQEFTYEIISPLVNLINVNGRLYFTANDGQSGMELWTSDGTAAGTNLVSDLFPGPEGAQPAQLTNVNGVIYFTANDGKTGVELWKYDPTACEAVNKNLLVQGSTSICSGEDSSITLKNTQAGISYQAYLNSSAVGNPVQGGGDITLTIPAVSLNVGNNTFAIKASGCTLVELTSKATISVLNCPTVSCSNTAQSSHVVNPSSGGTLSGTSLYLKTISGASSYTLQVSTSSDFTTGVIIKTTSSRLSTGTYYASFPELVLNQKYYVRVYTNLGLCWGPVTSFTTASAAGSAYVVNPSDGGTTTGTSLYLNTVSGATTYTLQVSSSANFTTGVITKTTASKLSTGTYYAVFPELVLNQRYYVRVKTNLSELWGRTTSFTRVSAIARLAASEETGAESLPAKVSLYPNPFESTLIIATSQPGELYITIVDNLGRIVYQNTTQGAETTLNLAHLKTGVYIVKTASEEGKTDIQRIVKR
ncbi:T9SS type A sorting domain-containing protein [Rhodocytophaga rosea]|uniref:T9SS type A sorting domain-containing protein n=1 Tax=Rhodocytophaga rosea TaxID=2704465 RepID=A0A6C0GQV2_9BACT|nr:ELWxxDGT repeat protein [Rhodocytophaga rosea]QHT70448.1 T9SS type A sorting domain-containing protein [Rhodocytophaga rosea]